MKKRASLVPAPARPRRDATDLTDRLLAREETGAAEKLPGPAAKKAGAKPKRAAARRPRQPKAAAPAPAGPAASGEPLEHALTQSQAALTALHQAAEAAPARYEIALRYRLDALAHHLRQVADFVATLARPDQP